MKALVLSGGKGTRLRPITHTFAKQLIPIANRPILFYGLEAISKAGIREVGIVVGDTHAEIEQAVGDGSKFGIAVSYIRQEAPLGLAHAVKISESFIRDEPFLMYLGDNLLREGMEGLVRDFEEKKPSAQILVTHVPNPQDFGVVEVDGSDRVLKLVEKPKKPKSDLALVGVYLFDRRVFEAVRELKPSFRGELEITDAIQWLLDRGCKVQCKRVSGWWKDTGKLEDLLEANRLVLETVSSERKPSSRVQGNCRIEGKVVLEEGAEVLESTIRGPAIIGRGSKVIRSFVGPFTSIDAGVVMENSEIEHSIVLEGAVIKGTRPIHDSLIGQGAEVIGVSSGRPLAFRLMMGDSSRVEIP